MTTTPTPSDIAAAREITSKYFDGWANESLDAAVGENARIIAKHNAELRRNQSPLDLAREHFGACPNCEPFGCCSGQECGCQGMPVGFNVTDKCGNDCVNKAYQERTQLSARVMELEKRLQYSSIECSFAALAIEKEEKPDDCKNVQCKQVHHYLDAVLESIGIKCDGPSISKAANIAIYYQDLERKAKALDELDDPTPITQEILAAMGFKPVPSDIGSNHADHMEKDGLNLWEYNDTRRWLYNRSDCIGVTTIGELRSLAKLTKTPLESAMKAQGEK